MLKITDEEKKALKGRGLILNNDGEHFLARIITIDGVLTDKEMARLAEAAAKFGNGTIAMTTRLTLEVQGIPYENLEPFCDYIAELGLYTGGTGSRVRPIVACKGTVCVHGLYDTQAMARELHEVFYKGWYDVKLPHKFKIGLGGCPNNCIKPGLNDFGIIGQSIPEYDPDECNSCKKCAVVEKCPIKAAHIDEDGIMQIDYDACNNCGKCVNACHFDCITEKARGFKLTVGGYYGKRQRMGNVVPGLFSKEEVFQMIERSLLLYREQGQTGERFGMFIERIGVDNFMNQLLAGDVMERKQAILEAKLHLTGGATC